jgi:hypothetical protein
MGVGEGRCARRIGRLTNPIPGRARRYWLEEWCHVRRMRRNSSAAEPAA